MGIALTLVLTGALSGRASCADDAIDFGRDVQPLFKRTAMNATGRSNRRTAFVWIGGGMPCAGGPSA